MNNGFEKLQSDGSEPGSALTASKLVKRRWITLLPLSCTCVIMHVRAGADRYPARKSCSVISNRRANVKARESRSFGSGIHRLMCIGVALVRQPSQ